MSNPSSIVRSVHDSTTASFPPFSRLPKELRIMIVRPHVIFSPETSSQMLTFGIYSGRKRCQAHESYFCDINDYSIPAAVAFGRTVKPMLQAPSDSSVQINTII
jgi:hypothetical protein